VQNCSHIHTSSIAIRSLLLQNVIRPYILNLSHNVSKLMLTDAYPGSACPYSLRGPRNSSNILLFHFIPVTLTLIKTAYGRDLQRAARGSNFVGPRARNSFL
jgi:hypothetical protein